MMAKKKGPHKVKNKILHVVRTETFRKRVEKNKKGKGSYARKAKSGKLDYSLKFLLSCFK